MRPIAELTAQEANNIRYVLMDIDDTITTDGKLPACAYSALWHAYDAGLTVVPITGRPAGWCDLIVRQWPVHGVVGENGALVFWEIDGHLHRFYDENAVSNTHHTLQNIKERVLREVPLTRIAGDQFARMFDIAIDFAEEEPRLPLESAKKIQDICEEMGAIAKISSIHVNTWMGTYDKLSMATRFLAEHYGYTDPKQVIFFGDSPNDEPMFAHFPLSVGVANVLEYAPYMKQLPTFITSQKSGEGFVEGIEKLLSYK